MSVKIIDTLKPKNNGSFPIVEAVDVSVTDELRLPEALASKADSSALAETNAALESKANASDVETATANLQGQINQIEISASAEAVVAPEVAAARVDAEGVEHATLKARIDGSETEFRTDISLIESSFLDDVIYLKLNFRSTGSRLISQHLPLTTFPLTVKCDSTAYSFYIAYYSSDGTLIGNTDWTKTEETYPTYAQNTAFVDIVCKADDGHNLNVSEAEHFGAHTISNAIASIQSDVETAQTDIVAAQNNINTLSSFDGLSWESGFIRNTGEVYREISSTRRFSNEIPCTENTIVSFVGETDHQNVSALTFYGANGAVLQTNSNIGDSDEVFTVTAPEGTLYLIISKKVSQADYIAANLPLVTEQVNKNTKDIINTAAVAENASATSNTLIKAINYGPQKRSISASFKKGYVHERNYTDRNISTNTAYSNLFETIGAVTVKVATGFKAVIIYVDSDLYCGSWSEWTTDEITILPETPYFCFEIRKADNSDFNISDVPDNVVDASVIIGSKIETGSICYVQTTGSDDNDGLTRSKPFATIQKAINAGFKNILVKEGVYTEGFALQDRNDVSIMLDHYYDTFSFETDEDNPKIVIDGSTNSISTGCLVQRCVGCVLKNIEIKNVSNRGFLIDKCSGLKVTDCIAHDCGVGATSGSVGGFVITNTDADFENCVCYNIGTNTAGTGAYHFDGFNIHGTGTTNFINCKAWNCMDDGISHHDACCGMIDGGEWYGCGKGGIASPTHGAKVNISNVYCHHNSVGIYADNDSAVTDRGNIILSNCVCVNNVGYDMRIGDYYDVIAINCVYSTIHGAANVTRYGIGSA